MNYRGSASTISFYFRQSLKNCIPSQSLGTSLKNHFYTSNQQRFVGFRSSTQPTTETSFVGFRSSTQPTTKMIYNTKQEPANLKQQIKIMEANQIIQAFTEVVRNQDYVFSNAAVAAIPELQKTIAGIETEPPEVVAEAIRQWYLDYEDVRDAVFSEEREIVSVPRTKPEDQENTVENRYRPLQEDLEKLKEKKTPPQNP